MAAIDYYDFESKGSEMPGAAFVASEYRAGLDVVDTLVDHQDRFTSHEALTIVQDSLHRFHDDLPFEYKLLDQKLTLLFDDIRRVEPSYRASETALEPIRPISAAQPRHPA